MSFREKTQTKSYELTLRTTSYLDDLLESTYNFYNQSAEFFLNLSLTFFGSLSPEFVEHDIAKIFFCWFSLESKDVAINSPYVVTQQQIYTKFLEYWKNSTNKEIDDNILQTLTEFNYDSDSYIFIDRRAEYFSLKQLLEINDEDVTLLLKFLPFFKDSNSNSESESETSHKNIRTWISNSWGKGKKKDKNTQIQVIESELNKLQHINNEHDISAKEFIIYLKIDNIDNWFKKLSLQKHKKGNSLYNLLLENKTIPAKYIISFKNKLQNKLSELQDKIDTNNQYSPDFAKKLLKYLEKSLGIKYYDEKKLKSGKIKYLERREPLAEAWSLGYGRILSSRSNSCNQYQIRKELKAKYDARTEINQYYMNLIYNFENSQAQKLEVESFNLRPKNLNGLKEFVSNFNQINDCEEALTKTKDEYDEKFGYYEFFRFLAKQNEIKDEEFVKNIEDASALIKCKRRLDNLKLFPLRHITENSVVHPHFGNSRPNIRNRWEKDESGEREIVKEIELEVFDGKNFRNEKFKVECKRAVNEVLYYEIFPNKKRIFRNDSLSFLGDNRAEKNVNLNKDFRDITIGGMLFSRDATWKDGRRKWYLKISPKLTYYSKEYDTSKDSVRVLGIDLGKRNLGCYAILNAYKDNSGKIKPEKKAFSKYPYSYDIMEIGQIKHFIKNLHGDEIDVLNDKGQLINADLLSLSNQCLNIIKEVELLKVKEFIKISLIGKELSKDYLKNISKGVFHYNAILLNALKDGTVNQNDLVDLLKNKSDKLLSIIFEKEKFSENYFAIDVLHVLCRRIKKYIKYISRNACEDILRNLLFFLMPSSSNEFKTKHSTPLMPQEQCKIHNVGNLTETRIESFERWQDACKSYLKQFNIEDYNNFFVQNLKKVENKLNNLKKERYRKLNNSIMRLAITNNVDVIGIEDLKNLKPSDERYKYLNRFISRWYVSRIKKELKEQCQPYSIYFMSIDPRGTSRQDCDDAKICRLRKVDLEKDKWETIAKELKIFKDSNPKDKRTRMYRDGVEKLCNIYKTENVLEIKTKALDRGEKTIYVPKRGGYYAKSKYFEEPIASDELASIQIARRAMLSLLFRKSSGEVNKKSLEVLASA
jgi:IS605 OrfB family transposase